MSEFDEVISTLDRSTELDAAQGAEIEEALPVGMELVQGDFADDEKWRIVQTAEQPVDDAPPPPAIDSPVIGECKSCGEQIREGEARVEDGRGLFHPEHYKATR
jgi:hypothetical protein